MLMRFQKFILLYFFILNIYSLPAQTNNFKKYKHISRLEVVNQSLPARINESSGLVYFRDKLWTINDSGDGPFIYVMDASGQRIMQIITIKNGINIDWEEITQDEKYIYVGDFGNNYGLRNRFTIYRVNKSSVPDTGNISIEADSIIFSYNNMPSPGKRLKRSAYDCEAMICFNDTLVLFSKNWVKPFCNIYFLPAQPGEYKLSPVKRIYLEGLITGASISPDKSEILLIGYKDYCPFVYLLNKFSLDKLTLKRSVHKYYSAMLGFQTEGITFISPDVALISCELNRFRQNTLFKIKFR